MYTDITNQFQSDHGVEDYRQNATVNNKPQTMSTTAIWTLCPSGSKTSPFKGLNSSWIFTTLTPINTA